ncbi:hypothetical protein BN1044_03998 [Hafnia alvei]|uniref:Uncharacterized protein n=1 Tax=Hafnia alvei TaxID=569 RepID=A0A1C6Z5X6_HAFAL|nr:hypothetical protein BN1044_03998 [Hafnia alvei]
MQSLVHAGSYSSNAESVTSSVTILADMFDHYVNTGFTHLFDDVTALRKFPLVLTSAGTEFLEYSR